MTWDCMLDFAIAISVLEARTNSAPSLFNTFWRLDNFANVLVKGIRPRVLRSGQGTRLMAFACQGHWLKSVLRRHRVPRLLCTFLVILVSFQGCALSDEQEIASSPSAGGTGETGEVFGTVTLHEGNCFPGPEDISNPCRSTGVSRRLFFFSPPLPLQTAGTWDSGYYIGPDAPSAETRSGADGGYRVRLPLGRYSVLVEDGRKKYCSSISDEGPCFLLVIADAKVKHDMLIDHSFI